jgi:hypothetical protein
MAKYKVTNISTGNVKLPPPFGRLMAKRQTLTFDLPASAVELNANNRYSVIGRMIASGLITVETVQDSNFNDHVEVPTVSMLGGGGGPGEYRAVADVPARDAIPANERTEGMLVRTNDTGELWTLGGDLLTWTLLVVSADVANILSTLGTIQASTSLAGLLTDMGVYFPFADLPDPDPSVVDALNTLNAQVGDRNYTGPHLTNGQTIAESLQALSAAVGSGGLVATQIGQVVLSLDGVTVTPQLPLTSVALDRGGWLLNDQGYMLVAG